jgi:tight adherence protein C
MNPLIILALLLICLPLAYLAWSFLSVDRKGAANAQALLSRGIHRAEVEKKPNNGLVEKIGYRLTPAGYVHKLDRLLPWPAAQHPCRWGGCWRRNRRWA